jgi:hypothetical protein
MGIFKDGFNAIKGAKELGEDHGGMPSIRGSFKDIAALSDDQGQGEILKQGVPTKARVNGFPMQVDRFSMGVELDVFPPEGGDPYQVQYTFPTARRRPTTRRRGCRSSRSSRMPASSTTTSSPPRSRRSSGTSDSSGPHVREFATTHWASSARVSSFA